MSVADRQMRLELDAGDVRALTVSLFATADVFQSLADSYPKDPEYQDSRDLLEAASQVALTAGNRFARHCPSEDEAPSPKAEKES